MRQDEASCCLLLPDSAVPITTAGDKDEELESPSNSLTSSPASLALQTPPSNTNIDSRNEAIVVVPGATASTGGIMGGNGMVAAATSAAAALAQKAAGLGTTKADIKATLDLGRAALRALPGGRNGSFNVYF